MAEGEESNFSDELNERALEQIAAERNEQLVRAMRVNPLAEGFIPVQTSTPENRSSASATLASEDATPPTASDKAKVTLSDAVIKFRADLMKPDATAIDLVKPLLDSFSSVKRGENQSIEIDNAAGMIPNYTLPTQEKARMKQLGIPEMAADLEFLQSAIGFNNSNAKGGKQDLEYVEKFTDKYTPQLAALEAQREAQIAQQAKLVAEQEAARITANEKSNAEYAALADERLAFLAAKEAETKEIASTTPAETTTPAKEFVVAALRPTVLDYSGNKYDLHKAGHTNAGMDLVNAAFFPDGKVPVDSKGSDGKGPRPIDFSYADMIVEVKTAKETGNLDAEKGALRDYLTKLDEYGLERTERFPNQKILGYVEKNLSAELSSYGRKPAQRLEEVDAKIAASTTPEQTPLTPVEPKQEPEIIAQTTTNPLTNTLAKLQEQAAQPEPEITPASPAILDTLTNLEEQAAQPEPEKAIAPAANPEQLAAFGKTAKSLAGGAADLISQKLQSTLETAQNIASTSGEILGAAQQKAAAAQQAKLAENESKEDARVEAMFKEADAESLAQVEVPTPAPVEPAIAATSFTAPILPENLTPLAETQPETAPATTPEVAKIEQPAPTAPVAEVTQPEPEVTQTEPAKKLTADELAIKEAEETGVVPRAIPLTPEQLVEIGEIPSEGVLPPKDNMAATKDISPAKDQTVAGANAHDYAIEIRKLMDGKDKNDSAAVKSLQQLGVTIELPEGKPRIVTSKAGAELGDALISLSKKGFSQEEFNLIATEIMKGGVVVDRAGKIDDIKADPALNPTQIRSELAAIAKGDTVAKN